MTTTEPPVSQQTVEEIIRDWPDELAEIAERVIERYGWVDEAAPSELLWYDNGPWKRTEPYREGVPHNFPKRARRLPQTGHRLLRPAGKVDDIECESGLDGFLAKALA